MVCTFLTLNELTQEVEIAADEICIVLNVWVFDQNYVGFILLRISKSKSFLGACSNFAPEYTRSIKSPRLIKKNRAERFLIFFVYVVLHFTSFCFIEIRVFPKNNLSIHFGIFNPIFFIHEKNLLKETNIEWFR